MYSITFEKVWKNYKTLAQKFKTFPKFFKNKIKDNLRKFKQNLKNLIKFIKLFEIIKWNLKLIEKI